MKNLMPKKVVGILLTVTLVFTGLLSGCESPNVSVSSITISPEITAINENVTISINVLSSEESNVFYSTTLTVNNEKIESKEINVTPGETKTITFSYTPANLGTYSVDVNGKTATFDVVNPAKFEPGELIISPDTLISDEELTLSLIVKNVGGLPGTFTSNLVVDENEISSRETIIEAGGQETISSTYIFESAGPHHIEFGGDTADINVIKKATFEATTFKVGPSFIYKWESAIIKATITNTGDVEGTFTVNMQVNEATERTKTLTLASGGSTDLIYFVKRDSSGLYTVTMLGKSESFIVNDLEEYANEAYLYNISYPVGFNVVEVDSTTTTIDGTTGQGDGMTIFVDTIPLDITPQDYFNAIVEGKQAEQPDWMATKIKKIKNGTAIGYEYNYSYTLDGKKWTGIGRLYKNGGYGYYLSYSSYAENWNKHITLAEKCLDSVVWPAIYNHEYNNSELGLRMTIPGKWNVIETGDPLTPLDITVGYDEREISTQLTINSTNSMSAQEYINDFFTIYRDNDYSSVDKRPFIFFNGSTGYECSGTKLINITGERTTRIIAITINSRLYSFTFSGSRSAMETWDSAITQLVKSFEVSTSTIASYVSD